MDAEDETASDAPTGEQIREAIHELTTRKEKCQDYLRELLESGETQLLTTVFTLNMPW
jgi:transposase